MNREIVIGKLADVIAAIVKLPILIGMGGFCLYQQFMVEKEIWRYRSAAKRALHRCKHNPNDQILQSLLLVRNFLRARMNLLSDGRHDHLTGLAAKQAARVRNQLKEIIECMEEAISHADKNLSTES